MSTDDHAPASPAPPRNDGIGQHLRRERLERGFTLEKLAEKTGLSAAISATLSVT